MPKRKVRSAAQIASQRKASRAAAVKRARSSTNPIPHGKSWPNAIKGSFGSTRRHKLGGKAYQKKSGGFKPAQEALDIIAGNRAVRPTPSPSQAIGHNGPGLKASPRGGGHKMAPSLKAVGAKPAKKPPVASTMHGSGTGLTSAHRYLAVNVAARKRAVKGKKVKHHGTF